MSHLKGVNDVLAVEADTYSHFCRYLDSGTTFFFFNLSLFPLALHSYFRKQNDTLTAQLKVYYAGII